MGDRLGIHGAVDFLPSRFHGVCFVHTNQLVICPSPHSTLFTDDSKTFAPGEARTHGLQIMRLTRCLLRYGGTVSATQGIGRPVKKFALPTGGLEPPIFGLGDRRLTH